MDVNNLEQEINARWRAMFTALAAGDDVSPAQRLRTEGLMEALVMLGQQTVDQVLAAMEVAYEECFGKSLAAEFGTDWRDFYAFPQIPAVGRRAPVFPSTPD